METRSQSAAPRGAARCPVCATEGTLYFRHPVCGIYRCGECTSLFSDYQAPADHVETVYADGYFHDGGAGYPGYHLGRDLLIDTGRRYGRLVAQHGPAGSVLDVGAAAGYILKGFHEAGWRGRGIEPNPRMASLAVRDSGMQVEVGTLEEYAGDGPFDLVSMIQVAAHFRDLPRAFANAGRLTRGGGFLLVETWNAASLTARFWGRRWHEFSPPSVLHWFTPRSLDLLVARHGFRAIGRGRPRKRISGAHARSLLTHAAGGTGPTSLLRHAAELIPAGLVIPYPSEDLFWALYRKE